MLIFLSVSVCQPSLFPYCQCEWSMFFLNHQSSSSDSSGVSSPEHAAGTSSSASSQYGAENLRSCSPHGSLDQSDATTLASYEHINRVLREAHFQSLHNRGQSRDRWLSETFTSLTVIPSLYMSAWLHSPGGGAEIINKFIPTYVLELSFVISVIVYFYFFGKCGLKL